MMESMQVQNKTNKNKNKTKMQSTMKMNLFNALRRISL